MTAAAPTVDDFTGFVRYLMAEGWSRHPVEFAGFLATRLWSDDSADTVVVFDLTRVHAFRERADGEIVWLFDGDLISVGHALSRLGPPTGNGLV